MKRMFSRAARGLRSALFATFLTTGAAALPAPADVHQEGLLEGGQSVGRVMKVADHARAQGPNLGKATRRLESGEGMVRVLVALQ